MKWVKRGLIYAANGAYGWAQTHAMIPTPDTVKGDSIRVYITCCDRDGVGRVGFTDLDAADPARVVRISKEPLLDAGAPGTFDENGALGCSVVSLPDGRKFLYYVGFELGHRIRYRLLTGLAVSIDGGASFRRLKKTPVLERSDRELFFRCGPFVVLENGTFRMWYVAGSSWIDIDGKSMPVYTVKYMESRDGVNWPQEGRTCIDIEKDDEHGFGRPYVIKDGGLYRMFYSIRVKHKGYRVGYAESRDGIDWIRKDAFAGIDVSQEGWDSRMVCYAAVAKAGGRTYMFYNGNDFGRTGFGYAELESGD